MQNKEGLLLVIEGVDGSGKSTQFKLLDERLRTAGYDVATLKFPRYDEPSSYFVRQYLAGAYGGAEEVGPYTASLFYALDRFAAAEQIRSARAAGKIVLVDRYTGSNMAHQGTKFYHADQRRGYFIWLDNLEYEMLRIPRPNLNFVMHVPTEVSRELLAKTGKKPDIHEKDVEHLKRSIEVFCDMCQLFPKDYMRIDCVRSGEMLPPETINNLIWEKISPILPTLSHPQKAAAKAETATTAAEPSTDNPYIEETAGGLRITQAGREALTTWLTEAQGNTHAFKNETDPEAIVAAFAHIAEQAGNIRTAILQTQRGEAKAEALHRATKRDAAIKQFAGIHVVVEDASSLLTQEIEKGKLGAYLEQAVRYNDYDRKDERSQYKYFTPEHFSGLVMQTYRQNMDTIFDHYAQIVRRLDAHLKGTSNVKKLNRNTSWKHALHAQARETASAVLPIASKSTVGIFASAETIERLAIRLLSDPLPEARDTGRNILRQAHQVLPTLLEADIPANATAAIAHRVATMKTMSQLADTYLPDNHAVGIVEPLALTSYWPRNELDLLPDILYEHSNVPLGELRNIVDKWPYQQKTEVLKAYLGERVVPPGRALEKAQYSWDIVCDYATFRALLQRHLVDDLELQELTPRYGYEVPDIIEDAGLTDLFEDCFDTSLQLHSALQAAGFREEAQYAVLRGHRMRWKTTYSAHDIFRISSLSAGPKVHPNVRTLVNAVHKKLIEVHPLLGDAMKSVDGSPNADTAA